jgi:hypothetical protein
MPAKILQNYTDSKENHYDIAALWMREEDNSQISAYVYMKKVAKEDEVYEVKNTTDGMLYGIIVQDTMKQVNLDKTIMISATSPIGDETEQKNMRQLMRCAAEEALHSGYDWMIVYCSFCTRSKRFYSDMGFSDTGFKGLMYMNMKDLSA